MGGTLIQPIGYTMEEAAQRLRIGRRNLQELVKDHPYYYSNGARKLFTEDDINSLVQVMRQEAESCRLSYTRPAPAKVRVGRSVAHTSESVLIEAQRLLRKTSRGRS